MNFMLTTESEIILKMSWIMKRTSLSDQWLIVALVPECDKISLKEFHCPSGSIVLQHKHIHNPPGPKYGLT